MRNHILILASRSPYSLTVGYRLTDQHFIVVDNAKQMQMEITNLLIDKKRCAEIGEKAQRLIQQQYTWERIGENLFQTLNGLL